MSKNWDLVPLKNILTERQEKPDMDQLLTGKIPIVEKIAFNEGKIYLRNDGKTKTGMILIRSGDLVLSGINATKGAIAIYPETKKIPIAATIHYSSYIVDKNKADISFLWWLLRSKKFKEILNEYLAGGIKTELKAKRFLPIPIPLPPLEEQRRIVGKIERLAEKIEEVRSLRLQTIKETSYLYDSFLSSIVNIAKNNWKKATVNDVIKSIDAGWSPQCEKRPAIKGEWGVLKTSSVQWNEFRSEENKALPQSLEPKPELSVKEGDVFVTRAGRRKRVAVVCAVNTTYPYLTISDKILRLKVKPEEIDYRFLAIILRSSLSQEYLVQRKTGLADAQVNISQVILRSTPIAYPSLSEQKRIVEYLDRLQSKIEIMEKEREKALKKTDALLPSILDKAFKGEL